MSSDDALMAGSALKMFSFALPAFVLIKVFSPAFAKEDTKTPFLCAICAVVVNLVIGLSTLSVDGPCRSCYGDGFFLLD